MTPMQKLKPQFDEFKNLLGSNVKEINLNKSEYKETYTGFCGEREQHIDKGVKSDFVRLYRLQNNKEDTYTLGFSFNYLDKKEEEFLINFSCSVGLKEKHFSKKIEMNVNECREKLNIINGILKVMENINDMEILDIVQNEMLGYNFINTVKTNKKRKIR